MGNIGVYESCRYYDLRFQEENVLRGYCEKNKVWDCTKCEERKWNYRCIKVKTTNLKHMERKDAEELERILKKYGIKYEAQDLADIYGRISR